MSTRCKGEIRGGDQRGRQLPSRESTGIKRIEAGVRDSSEPTKTRILPVPQMLIHIHPLPPIPPLPLGQSRLARIGYTSRRGENLLDVPDLLRHLPTHRISHPTPTTHTIILSQESEAGRGGDPHSAIDAKSSSPSRHSSLPPPPDQIDVFHAPPQPPPPPLAPTPPPSYP